MLLNSPAGTDSYTMFEVKGHSSVRVRVHVGAVVLKRKVDADQGRFSPSYVDYASGL